MGTSAETTDKPHPKARTYLYSSSPLSWHETGGNRTTSQATHKTFPMIVYLAGPMQGISEFNFPLFHKAAAQLRSAGHTVFSPAEADIERHGADISRGNITGSVEQAAREHGFSRREALAIDLTWICKYAEAIALLPGWEHSGGARAEKAAGDALGLKIIYL